MSRSSLEESYFQEYEAHQRAQLRAQLEAKAKDAADHRAVGEQVGLADEQLVRRIRELGFEGETARVLHLMPLVEVAWADGKVSDQERKAVLAAAEAHQIEPGSQAAILLASMLETRPSAAVREQVFEVLRDLLKAKGMAPHDVLAACTSVAEASGGFLGIGTKVSKEEQAVIEQLTRTFGDRDVLAES